MNAEKKDIRWKQRFANFERAILLLKRTLQIETPSEAERGGIIQFYEMSFELAWKLMKDYLEAEGFAVKSPRQAIKQAFQVELLNSGQVWIDALGDRNLTAHTYNEKIALAVIKQIRNRYYPALDQFYAVMKAKL